MGQDSIHYARLVQYKEALDPFADAALRKFAPTIENPKNAGVRLLEESIGETARVYAIDGTLFYLAENVEILGTKVAVAVEMARRDWGNRGRYFRGIGQDTANMSLNDLVAVGAQPFSYSPIMSIGDNEFVKDLEIVDALLEGYLQAANDAGAVIAGGETGTLREVVVPGQADLSGGSLGIILPRERFCHSGRVELGDILYGLTTNGPHANGLTAIRRIGGRLPHGFFTELPSGRTFGEVVLRPTPGYAGVVNAMLRQGVPIHYLQPITGHGFKKIARSKKDLTYRISDLPEMPEVFRFIQEQAQVDDKEMLETYNCGVGFVIYASADVKENIISTAKDFNMEAFEMGKVEEGPRRVVVEPLNVEFSTEDISKG